VAEIPDVVAGTPVESNWGNDIRDRTVQRYADATERDVLVPVPVPGALAYLENTGIVTIYNGTAWALLGPYTPPLPVIGATTFPTITLSNTAQTIQTMPTFAAGGTYGLSVVVQLAASGVPAGASVIMRVLVAGNPNAATATTRVGPATTWDVTVPLIINPITLPPAGIVGIQAYRGFLGTGGSIVAQMVGTLAVPHN
jgi:hypothetical protein